MPKLQLIFLLFISSFIALGCCLKCFQCTESLMKGCYYGQNESMTVANCRSTKICASYKYKTTLNESSNYYITTVRGCAQQGECSQLMQTKVDRTGTQTGIFCELCDTDFCNGSRCRESFQWLWLYCFIIVIINSV